MCDPDDVNDYIEHLPEKFVKFEGEGTSDTESLPNFILPQECDDTYEIFVEDSSISSFGYYDEQEELIVINTNEPEAVGFYEIPVYVKS